MGGLLALNIHIQDISFEYRALQERAGSLSNQEAELKVAVNTERSTATLAQRASLLGMVPYPYPATINLADGTISGELRPAVSSELARQIWNAQLLAPKLPVPQIVPAPKPSTTPTSPPIDGEGDAGETASASDDVEAGNQ
jgi:hypothetical protein